MEILIQNARPDDFKDIFLLFQQLWPSVDLNKDMLEKTFVDVLHEKKDFALCSRFDKRINGFISGSFVNDFWHSGLVCHVSILIVDAAARRLHIGTTLMDYVKHLAIKNKCKAIELDSAFHREQTHLFYEKYGFNKRAFTFSHSLSSS